MNVPGPDYYDTVAAPSFRGTPVYYHYALKFFKPESGASIIDLGCGSGGNMVIFGKKGHPITGVDFSAALLSIGQRAILRVLPHPKKRANIHFIHSAIEDLNIHAQFDWALCTEVLEHVRDPLKILCKARQFAPSVYVSAPSTKVGGPGHVRGVSSADLTQWLEDAGYSSIKVFNTPALRLWHGIRADSQTIGIAHNDPR